MLSLDAPEITDSEIQLVVSALKSGYVSSIGPYVREFEQAMASFLGIEEAVAVQSGTAGLHLCLRELGIGPGDEVIVPVLTFVATANAILYNNATPVFVDVDPKTWTIDPRCVERAITSRTKAIVPVHLYGVPCNMDQLLKIAHRHSLFVVEDAAESLGAYFGDTPTGCFGDFGVFSFNGNKTLTTGGGGMVVGTDIERIEHVRFMANQAKSEKEGMPHHPEVGFNYRMNNLSAALGLAQLKRVNQLLAKKREINRLYRYGLADYENLISFQDVMSNARPSWWLTAIIFSEDCPKKLSHVIEFLSLKGIPTRRVFTPLVLFPPYGSTPLSKFPVAKRLFENGLCLPSSVLMEKEDVFYTIEQLTDAIRS